VLCSAMQLSVVRRGTCVVLLSALSLVQRGLLSGEGTVLACFELLLLEMCAASVCRQRLK
jgi:hypothetical protein